MARKQLHQSTTELIWHFLAPFFPKWLALKEKLRTNVVTPFDSPFFIGSESPEVRRYTNNFTNTENGKVQEKVKR